MAESGRRAGNEVGGGHRRGSYTVSPMRSDTLFDHKGDRTPACLACFTSQSELLSPPSYKVTSSHSWHLLWAARAPCSTFFFNFYFFIYFYFLDKATLG